tara:strand:+ start:12641 stop:12793 length:153 start_codon:yes stop_codon:yes gene_type:complete
LALIKESYLTWPIWGLKIGKKVTPGDQMDVSLHSETRYQEKTYLDKEVIG